MTSPEVHMDARVVLRSTQRMNPVCRLHAKAQDAERHESGTLLPHERKRKCRQVVHLDLAGPLPESKEGYKYILGIADNFSAFVMAIAIKG